MTDQEKEKKTRDSNKKFHAKFCPLIKDYCRQDCVCFDSAMFSETKHFFEASCRSPLIDGVISVEGNLI